MTLEEIRPEIDKLDLVLKDTFLKRMALSEQVANVKAKTHAPIYQADREKQMIERLTADVEAELKPFYEDFLKNILSLSRKRQEEIIESLK